MPTQPIWMKLYSDPVFTAAARIIGYAGIDPFAFYDQAKKLPIYNQAKFQAAVFELTRSDRREASPPRYELNVEARKHCRQLLGIPPEEPPLRPIHEILGEPPPAQPEEPKPKKRSRKKK